MSAPNLPSGVPAVLPLRKAAQTIHRGPTYVYDACMRGELSYIELPSSSKNPRRRGHLLIRVDDLVAFLAKHTKKARA